MMRFASLDDRHRIFLIKRIFQKDVASVIVHHYVDAIYPSDHNRRLRDNVMSELRGVTQSLKTALDKYTKIDDSSLAIMRLSMTSWIVVSLTVPW